MEKFLALVGIALITLAYVGGEREGEPAPVQLASANLQPSSTINADDEPVGNGSAEFTTHRSGDGHFYADVRINGITSRMLIDTGASSVILSRGDAQRAGIQARPGEFTSIAQTAGGQIALKSVTIDRMALGPINGRNVRAMVAETDIPVSLLGQSFLERVGTVEISGDELRLR